MRKVFGAGSRKMASPLIWHFPYYHPETKFAELAPNIGVGDFATSQTRPHSALRKGDRKLILFHEDQRVELYDLVKDPSEQADLSAFHPDEAARLKAELIESLNHMNAHWPVPAG